MNEGFGTNLEGFIIEGNLSLTKTQVPLFGGDGSFEASGTIYVNNITEYTNSIGVTIQDVFFGNENIIVPYTQGSLNPTSASLLIDGGIYIRNTTNATSITSGGGLSVLGGASFKKDVYIGGITNVNNNRIVNLQTPILDYDAATKKYVDDYGINDNFTKGQFIIGESDGNDIRGYDNLFFDIEDGTHGTVILNSNTSLEINNTIDALGLGSGGSVNINGGVSILGKTYIGDELDVNKYNIRNVKDPVLDLDAVNKRYVDNMFINSNVFFLESTLIPFDIPDLVFCADVRAFVTYIYVHTPGDCSIYTIKGINRITSWEIQKTFVGTLTGVEFYIRSDTGVGRLQYTNANPLEEIVFIRYTTQLTLNNAPDIEQINLSINSNISTPTNISELVFDNTTTHAVKITMYLSNDSQGIYGLIYIKCLLIDNNWIINSISYGDVTGVTFHIDNDGNTGRIMYTNSSNNNYDLRLEKLEILKTQLEYTLTPNITEFTEIPILTFDSTLFVFSIELFAYIPTQNKAALYRLEGYVCDGNWFINSTFIGDIIGIQFNIQLSDDNQSGVITYKNPTTETVYIKYKLEGDIPTIPHFLLPNAVLRGNGTDQILATPDFIYSNYVLTLGTQSSILVNNTENCIGYDAGGSFTCLGGGSFSKNLCIGGDIHVNNELLVNDINISPSLGDITKEQFFMAQQNVVNQSITGFIFDDPSIKSFNGTLCITVTTTTDELDSLYTVKTLKKSSGWIIDYTSIGDSLAITLNINNSGQVLYSSPYFLNWVSTEMHFRGLTTTI